VFNGERKRLLKGLGGRRWGIKQVSTMRCRFLWVKGNREENHAQAEWKVLEQEEEYVWETLPLKPTLTGGDQNWGGGERPHFLAHGKKGRRTSFEKRVLISYIKVVRVQWRRELGQKLSKGNWGEQSLDFL